MGDVEPWTLVYKIEKRNDLITDKAQAIPHWTDKQRQNAKTISRRLNDQLFEGFQGCGKNVQPVLYPWGWGVF